MTDITKPLDGKVDESLNKIVSRLGTNLEWDSAPTGFLAKLILATSVVLILIFGSIPFFLMWYRRRYPSLTKDEVAFFLRGKGKDDTDEEAAGLECRKFPEEFKIPRDRIILLNLIGKGNFGLVYKASLSDEDGGESFVAVKIPKPYCPKESFKGMLSEVKVLCYVGQHPHVIEFVGAHVEEIGRGMVYIATKLCENGALQEFLRKAYSQLEGLGGGELVKSQPNPYELSRYAHEIAMGMEYLSSRKVIHGDLSTRNVLLDSNYKCKIGDFGLSRKLKGYQVLYEKQRQKGVILELPWRWLPLESLTKFEFSTKSDVWMYGITLWEIFSLGCLPYPSKSFTKDFLEELEGGFRMSAPSLSTDAIYEQMRLCWDAKPERRPTFTQLAQFFASTRHTQYTTVVL